MHKTTHLRHVLELNLAMLFISTSGALGRYIELPVPVTIGIRALFAAILLFLYCRWRKISFSIERKDLLSILFTGVLMGLHWLTYFYALRLSNVAIGMLSLFTYPVITALLEPLLLKTKFDRSHLFLGALVLIGVYFLLPEMDVENSITQAVILGILSALFYALRNLILKAKVSTYNGSVLMWYQLVVIFIFLLPTFYFYELSQIKEQWEFLLILAFLTTAVGHTLFLQSFKQFSITTASIISSMQPIYGIILGMIFLGEIPALNTFIGGGLILCSVVVESIRSYKTT
ncbi:DMT family transporter [Aquimarina intermedia]|uniref:Threonine/homoserine efflux transporter RhtA n=1 Tax=Aquimarina intermedia TaxID=350814 RepID=A0A5S5BUY1_9FLAO|nr:DMT family transporter [Aquimarina intermedia]TYP70022.1 threonine/homoserine efflux transporter RhtA [Aquimarina intermedia]